MEALEDVVGSSSTGGSDCSPNPMTILTKRKRTKRLRAPFTLPNIPASSSTSSLNFSSATEEEEDMAHCLILLAQGRSTFDHSPPAVGSGGNMEKFISRKFTETMTTAGGKAGFYVYECKTCNRCFPSFQALGGHRVSHKKPKLAIHSFLTDDPKQIAHGNTIADSIALNASSPTGNNNKLRVHECSICGAEFSSGQALGGHMRRHRPIIPGPPELQGAMKKDRSIDLLSLDLNLPAPTEEPTFFPTMDGRGLVGSVNDFLLLPSHMLVNGKPAYGSSFGGMYESIELQPGHLTT